MKFCQPFHNFNLFNYFLVVEFQAILQKKCTTNIFETMSKDGQHSVIIWIIAEQLLNSDKIIAMFTPLAAVKLSATKGEEQFGQYD